MSVLRIKDRLTGRFVPIAAIKGDKGDNAGFGTVEASVDDHTGTPSVDVTVSGPDTAKDISFEFHNLKYDDSELRSDMSDVESDFDNLNAQFQTAVSALTVDDELLNVRVGDDNITYTTAGEAVRTQFSNLKSELVEVTDITGLESNRNNISFTDGRAISSTSGSTNANANRSYSGYINVEGYDSITISTIVEKVNNSYYGLAFYSSNSESSFISGVRETYDTSLSDIGALVRTIPIPNGTKYFRTTWIASTHAKYSELEFVCTLNKYGTLNGELEDIHDELTAVSANVLNPSALVIGKFINVNGTQGTSESYAHTDYIAVKSGDIIKGYAGESTTLNMRYVCAYDANKSVLSAKGAENVTSYTVPEGVAFVRITGYVRTDGGGINNATARISLTGADTKAQTYKQASVSDFSSDNYTTAQMLLKYPLSTLNGYILKTLSYKPLGVLSKPYICLVSDDGDAELATYTIPMLQSKGDIPCTFAVMQASRVFQTQAGINAVVDAVNNHSCEIAQHGVTLWDTYDEYTFNRFLDIESQFFATIGLTPYGAVCPQHAINDMVKAVAGGRLGCVRTGYGNADITYGSTYQNGARSNIYALASQSSLDGSLSDQINALVACKANNWLRIIHWHENELTDEKKAVLEGIIDYAINDGVFTFITMKDIPTII